MKDLLKLDVLSHFVLFHTCEFDKSYSKYIISVCDC